MERGSPTNTVLNRDDEPLAWVPRPYAAQSNTAPIRPSNATLPIRSSTSHTLSVNPLRLAAPISCYISRDMTRTSRAIAQTAPRTRPNSPPPPRPPRPPPPRHGPRPCPPPGRGVRHVRPRLRAVRRRPPPPLPRHPRPRARRSHRGDRRRGRPPLARPERRPRLRRDAHPLRLLPELRPWRIHPLLRPPPHERLRLPQRRPSTWPLGRLRRLPL